MIERILEADGITREMIEAQQKRLNLLQRLADASPEVADEIIKQEEVLIDGEFFLLLRRLTETTSVRQDQNAARRLAELQNQLIQQTSYGKTLMQRSTEWNEAVQKLQSAGDKLSREKLLDFVTNTDSEVQIQAYASLARPLMDYTYFQLLSEKIDRARGDGRKRLVTLRETLLELTRQIDQSYTR